MDKNFDCISRVDIARDIQTISRKGLPFAKVCSSELPLHIEHTDQFQSVIDVVERVIVLL